MGSGASVSCWGISYQRGQRHGHITNNAAISGGMTITVHNGLNVQAISAGKASAEALASSVNVNLLAWATSTPMEPCVARRLPNSQHARWTCSLATRMFPPRMRPASTCSANSRASMSASSPSTSPRGRRIGGESGAQRNSVRVQVGDGTTLNVHDGNANILAFNEPAKNEIAIDNGLNIGLVNVTVSCAGTETYLETSATVGKNANIKAIGSFTQFAQDKLTLPRAPAVLPSASVSAPTTTSPRTSPLVPCARPSARARTSRP